MAIEINHPEFYPGLGIANKEVFHVGNEAWHLGTVVAIAAVAVQWAVLVLGTKKRTSN